MKRTRRGTLRRALRAVAFALLLILVGVSGGLAQGPSEESGPVSSGETLQGVGLTGDDGGDWEVGAHASGGNLAAYAWSEASWLYWKLRIQSNWRGRYIYNDYWSWEEDFKRYALGGKEYMYLDTVDLQFYVGHGGPGYFTFANSAHDDHWLTTNDCYRSWGDNDNDWVALTSCQVLADSALVGWARCMRGTHLILGFKTNASARLATSTQGYQFAKYLVWPYKYRVAQAWYKAGDRSQPSGRIVRAVINELGHLNDRPYYGYLGAGDSWDWDAWVQTHYCGSEPARQVDIAALNGQMPVFKTQALTLDEANAKYSELGGVFGVPVTETAKLAALDDGDTEIWHSQSGGLDLEMDSSGGLYGYMDLDNLWTFTETQRAYLQSGPRLSAQDAQDTADQFLTDNDLMSPGARFYEVVSDTISGGSILTETAKGVQASLLADEQPLVYQVIYSRDVTHTVPGLTAAETFTYSVVGPGAKQKVYVPVDSGLMSKLDIPVVGAMGGWRQIQQPSLQAADQVTMLDASTVYTLYQQLGERVALNNIPIDADTRVISESLTTVAYWEEPAGASQGELTPAYVLDVSFSKEGVDLGRDYVYIPVNETYMRPYAEIESAPSGTLGLGQVITLTASDASKPLDQLGYTGALTFTLGSGDSDNYMYFWYLNSVDEDSLIATGIYATAGTIVHTISTDLLNRDGVAQQSIILKVTDSETGLSGLSTATFDVVPPIFLPLSMK